MPVNPQIGQVLGAQTGYDFGRAGSFVMLCRYTDWPIEHPVSANISVVNSPATGLTFSASGLSMPVYATNVPGVGFAMMAQDPGQSMHAISHSNTTLLATKHNKPNGWGLYGRVYLVATGPVSDGTIASSNIARYTLTNVTTADPGYVAINFSGAVIARPLKPTCTVSTPSISMPLGAVASRDFKGPGSHAGSVTQSITLNCSGASGGTLDVWITLTDQTSPANRSHWLSLTRDSTARGVALQLLAGSQLVSYGPDSSAIGNPNQWQVGSTGNGTVKIPLSARYVQTEKTITPGTANGLASFTLSYR
ncbi:fimbrial protein [Pseudomonas sp. MWU15-20650]|uniref:fimbrial protein n=1 Tax=Pseudomonas sp. MWU15-20650 TaxID=2933107 RepID=UPI00200D164E|nr:fimbrial protein [Pseudomonas sp. MWU15-20650]